MLEHENEGMDRYSEWHDVWHLAIRKWVHLLDTAMIFFHTKIKVQIFYEILTDSNIECENINWEMGCPYQSNCKAQKITAQSGNELIGKILYSKP